METKTLVVVNYRLHRKLKKFSIRALKTPEGWKRTIYRGHWRHGQHVRLSCKSLAVARGTPQEVLDTYGCTLQLMMVPA